MKRKKLVYGISIALIIMAALIGFKIYSNIQTAKDKAAAMGKGRIATVEVMPVFKKSITPTFTLTASLDPVWRSDISPKLDGRIGALFVEEGQWVTAGQSLATLENGEFGAQVSQAQGTLYASAADLSQARVDLSRAQSLFAQGAISQQQLDAAGAKVANLEGLVRANRGNVGYQEARLENTNVTTPHRGVILNRYLQTGDYAKAGTAIVTVADTSVMLAKATVGEGQITQLKLGDMAQVLVEALSTQPFIGKITKIVPAAAVPTRTFTIEVSIDNADNTLLAGLTAKVLVNGKIHPDAMVVPEAALVLFEDQRTVFVLSEDQVVQRKLKIGYVGDGYAEVLDGLKPGELIVVAGQNTVRDGARVKVAATREAGQL
ncbi:efflux RND transporter periplasmic adaptor subunit [Azotosporobacter soli]|uniref:efflux RND transporter periplasmic adaptor subunit n=1 Tax=Azotosporobacter soli TaxID=3055040 RepID=UPI0031FED6FD